MSREFSHKDSASAEWDAVIEEAVRQLQECEARAARLRVTVDYFNKRKERGGPFPGESVLRQKGLLLESETSAETMA